ncbi:MAG: SRPBCC domain-containing protein [Gemmatimonadales bacterium]
MTTAALPPIERSVSVSWDQEAAFRRFTAELPEWWPRRTHSIGGERVRRVVFEGRVGGRLFEEHIDGRRFQWGQVLEWDPPRRVRFTFHPSREPATAQEVEVRFEPEGGGTRLVLTATKWENWGRGARAARRGYRLGWGYVLNVWAGRRTAGMRLLDGISAVVGVVERFRGGTAGSIARARGEIPGA